MEIVIDRTQKAGDMVRGVELAVGKLAAANFEGAPLEWDPAEFLATTRLVCDQDPSVSLSLGLEPPADFLLSSSRERIKKDQAARLELKVSRPESLVPGVYRGELKLRFSSSELDSDLFGRVRLVVAVRGRRIVESRFLHARNAQIRFGMPADLTATIDTIDCELGTGTFQFSYQPAIAPAPQSLSPLEVPFAANTFQDPKLVLQASTYPNSWNDTAFWTDVSSVEQPTRMTAVPCRWFRHTITLHLGDCDDLGIIRSVLEWPQADVAPGLAGSLTRQVDSEVTEGIWVRPRIAFTGEPIVMTLASATDLGKSVPALLIDENQRPQQVTLNLFVRQKSTDPKSPPLPRAAGEPYLYQVKLIEKRLGTFAVRFPEDAAAAHPLLKELHDGGYRIAVWIKKHEPVKQPLRVFASFEPFWWDWLSNPYRGNAWKERRSPLWQIEFDQERLSNVSLTLAPLAAHPRFLQGTAEPDREPVLAVTGPDGTAFVTPAPVKNPQEGADASQTPDETSGAPAGETASQSPERSEAYWTGLTSPTMLDGEVRFANQEIVRRKPLIGTFVFPVRMSLRGESNGVSVVRIFESAVPVEVTTDMVYYRQIAGYVVAGLLLLILMYWMYRRANPRGPRVARRDEVPQVVDSMDDFGQPAAKPTARQPAERAETPRETPPPSRGPAPKDDIENW